MLKYLYISILLLFTSVCLNAEMINIGVLNYKKVETLVFSVNEGTYAVYADSKKIEVIDNTEILQLKYVNDKIQIKSLDKDYGNFTKVNFIGLAVNNSFNIKPKISSKKTYKYEDNLLVKVNNYYNYLSLINNINLDNYIAGVVEAEVGRNPPQEYFKLQAIICRTYALKNINRHKTEGFSLCDRVHCQAYHGKPKSSVIKDAAKETEDIVIVDSDINLITATFFSNCGGQTANSEEVWNSPLYYLRSVKDTFCLNENNAVWKKTIDKYSWKKYLIKHGIADKHTNHECGLEHFQIGREEDLIKANVGIPHTKIRTDFKLKSAVFDVEEHDDKIVLKGKGFGHGVGLCQEGAMRMAKLGYNYAQILHYYYQDVHMIDLKAIDFFKEDL